MKISYDTYISLCKIAKIIACHNIFVCDSCNGCDKDKYNKNNLSHLIVGNSKFHKMPHGNFLSRDDYGKLYCLLALTDTLEPTKRKIDLCKYDIQVNEAEIIINLKSDNIENFNYAKIQFELNAWLNFIEVSVEKNSEGYSIEYRIKENNDVFCYTSLVNNHLA